MNFIRFVAVMAVLSAISGCTPDSMRVDIYTSDIELAHDGEVIEIPAQITFQIMGKDKENLLSRATDAAKKYLHEKSSFSESKAMGGRHLVIDKKLPMGTTDSLRKYLVANPRLVVLVVEGDTVIVESTNILKALDSELSDLNMMLGADLPAKQTRFNVISDSRNPVLVAATAVFVSKKPYLLFSKTLERRESVEVEFKRGDASVYSEISPIIEVKAEK